MPSFQAEVQKELKVNLIIEKARELVAKVSRDLEGLDSLLTELEDKNNGPVSIHHGGTAAAGNSQQGYAAGADSPLSE